MEWRVLPWLAAYEISESGLVRRRWRGGHYKAGHLLKGRIIYGYRYHLLTLNDGTQRGLRCNRIVCEAFHGPSPSADHQAAHNDGDRLNNAASNLRWATRIENEKDKIAHNQIMSGERNGQARLTEEKVSEIRNLYQAGGYSYRTLADKYGMSKSAIDHIITKRKWKHVGHCAG